MGIVNEILLGVTALIVTITGLIRVINFMIKESSLLADNLWELKKYGLKRRKKDGSSPILDKLD